MKHTHILIYYTVYKGLYDAHRHISFSQKWLYVHYKLLKGKIRLL